MVSAALVQLDVSTGIIPRLQCTKTRQNILLYKSLSRNIRKVGPSGLRVKKKIGYLGVRSIRYLVIHPFRGFSPFVKDIFTESAHRADSV